MMPLRVAADLLGGQRNRRAPPHINSSAGGKTSGPARQLAAVTGVSFMWI
jgi:hypothetical protein